jgi:hypothetical protein
VTRPGRPGSSPPDLSLNGSRHTKVVVCHHDVTNALPQARLTGDVEGDYVVLRRNAGGALFISPKRLVEGRRALAWRARLRVRCHRNETRIRRRSAGRSILRVEVRAPGAGERPR